jgi:acetyltransferase-like isoleucine patch superfamily enzyme
MYQKIIRVISIMRFSIFSLIYGPRLHSHGRNYFQKGCLHLAKSAKFELKEKNVLDRGFDIEVKGQLIIGSRNYFNKNVKIVCFDKIEIGDDCLIADSVHIYDHDHCCEDTTKLISAQGYVTAAVVIGNNVWLGAKVTVLKGVTIGDGTIVGANSIVTRDLPANSICGGIPAKVIKLRTRD